MIDFKINNKQKMGIICCCACCCQMLSSKALEINLIVMSSILSFLLFVCLVAIKWTNISAANVVLFVFMFLISVSNIVISSFLRYWRANNLIKTIKRSTGIKLSITCFVLIIICFIICFIEEIIFSYSYITTNYPCLGKDNDKSYNSNNYYYNYKNNLNTTRFNNPNIRILDNDIYKENCLNKASDYYIPIVKDGELFLAYFTFSCLEIYLTFGMFIWYILIERIKKGLDGPAPEGVVGPGAVGVGNRAMYDQYGRQVVVVQPGDVVVMDGQRNVVVPSNQYNNQYYNPNSNQYNIPNSNQYNTPNNNQYNNQIQNEYNNNNIPDNNNEEDLQNISAQVHPEKPDSQEYKLN